MKKPAKKTTASKKTAAKTSTSKTDIVDLILKDHIPLKKEIKILKNPDIAMEKRVASFAKFAPTLLAHADPEEKSLYTYMTEENKDLRVEGFEGETEHSIASQLVDQINATKDPQQWTARVKVLAELVEHHIEEEEEDMLPDVKKQIDAEDRSAIGQNYLRLRQEFQETNETPNKIKKDKAEDARAH